MYSFNGYHCQHVICYILCTGLVKVAFLKKFSCSNNSNRELIISSMQKGNTVLHGMTLTLNPNDYQLVCGV